MLVIQHIWHRWDQATRGASGYQRPILDRAYPLPEMAPVANVQQDALVHTISSDMFRWTDVANTHGPMAHDDWVASVPALDWRVRDSAAEISLHNPSRWRVQTKWPAWLPSPLFVLQPGETARIEWNGRFRESLFGSNRASYYEPPFLSAAMHGSYHFRPSKSGQARNHPIVASLAL